jgi:hypothetical protein
MVDMVRKFKPDCKIPDDPIYHQVRRKCRNLKKFGYVDLVKKYNTNWEKTEQLRIDEIVSSVQNIFNNAITGGAGGHDIISTGTGPGSIGEKLENKNNVISTAQTTDNSFHVVPTGKYITLLSGMQNSNHFSINAKSRGEMGQLRIDRDLNNAKPEKRKHCPYYVSVRTRGTRIDAIYQLRRITQHRKFKRRDQAVVNPELVQDLQYVQGKFNNYVEDIQDLKCVLIHREDNSIKILDYQTRFTDETRKAGTIARFYRTTEKAGESFNTAVFLTLTSYPPSEGSKHQHRRSLWHVNRYFAKTWNAYVSLLQKRKRANRREELLQVMRSRVEKVRPVLLDKENKIKLTRDERIQALEPMKKENFRPKYLMVYEFQKNGMIHGHCLIFGSQWLDQFEQIKRDWQRLGQGERIHVYGVKNEGTGWEWSSGQPKDSRNRKPIDYLMKYLGKGVRVSSGHGMYWAINKRFFTSSRALTHDEDLPIEMEKIPSMYDFLGSIKGDNLPDWLEARQRSRSQGPSRWGSLDWSGNPAPVVPA